MPRRNEGGEIRHLVLPPTLLVELSLKSVRDFARFSANFA